MGRTGGEERVIDGSIEGGGRRRGKGLRGGEVGNPWHYGTYSFIS